MREITYANIGAGRSSAAQHSQSLHAFFMHVPGFKIAMPSNPYDAKGLLKTAIRDESPVMFFEYKMLYNKKGPVPDEEYTIPFSKPLEEFVIPNTERIIKKVKQILGKE